MTTTVEQRFGRRLQRVRELAKESRAELGQALGKDEATVWRWENGDGGPRADALLRLLRRYRRQADYLLFGNAEKEPPPPGRDEALATFLATPLGQSLSEDITIVLSSIRFASTPTVQMYKLIALALVGASEDDD